MEPPSNPKPPSSLASWSAIGIAALLLIIAFPFDPIGGSSPDSGLIDFGPTGTKWLLGSLGAIFLVAGIWSLIKIKSVPPE